MIAPLLALLLQSGAPATDIAADDDSQWVCTATAKGKRDARVDVAIHMTVDRSMFEHNVGWTPPHSSRPTTSRPDIRPPQLTLYFEYAEADDIDELSNALGDVSSVDAPDGTLDDMALAVNIDQGKVWYVALDEIDFDPDQRFGETPVIAPPLDFRSAWLSDGDTDIDVLGALDTARTVTLSVVNRKGHPVARASYDLSAIADRNRLFASAWKKAEKMALSPRRCAKVGDE